MVHIWFCSFMLRLLRVIREWLDRSELLDHRSCHFVAGYLTTGSHRQLESGQALVLILRTSNHVVPSNAGLPQRGLPNWIIQPSVWPKA